MSSHVAVSTAGSTEWRTRQIFFRFFIGCRFYTKIQTCKFLQSWRLRSYLTVRNSKSFGWTHWTVTRWGTTTPTRRTIRSMSRTLASLPRLGRCRTQHARVGRGRRRCGSRAGTWRTNISLQAHLAGWNFPYLTYHSGNAQVSPAGEVVETGESEFLRKTRIISETKSPSWSSPGSPTGDSSSGHQDTETDQRGLYLEEKMNVTWRLGWGDMSLLQRGELHCYWLGGCGAACQPVDWPSGGYFKL